MGKLSTGFANLIVALVVAAVGYLCFTQWDQVRPRLEQVTGRRFNSPTHLHRTASGPTRVIVYVPLPAASVPAPSLAPTPFRFEGTALSSSATAPLSIWRRPARV